MNHTLVTDVGKRFKIIWSVIAYCNCHWPYRCNRELFNTPCKKWRLPGWCWWSRWSWWRGVGHALWLWCRRSCQLFDLYLRLTFVEGYNFFVLTFDVLFSPLYFRIFYCTPFYDTHKIIFNQLSVQKYKIIILLKIQIENETVWTFYFRKHKSLCLVN